MVHFESLMTTFSLIFSFL